MTVDRLPNAAQVRRALARAERGAALDVVEATALLAARGEDLDRLCAVAARVRDAGLEATGRPGVVTYSPKVFIPVTRLCRDSGCRFRTRCPLFARLDEAEQQRCIAEVPQLEQPVRGRADQSAACHFSGDGFWNRSAPEMYTAAR